MVVDQSISQAKGHSLVYWDAFRNLHGDFFIEQPMSVAMDAFSVSVVSAGCAGENASASRERTQTLRAYNQVGKYGYTERF